MKMFIDSLEWSQTAGDLNEFKSMQNKYTMTSHSGVTSEKTLFYDNLCSNRLLGIFLRHS